MCGQSEMYLTKSVVISYNLDLDMRITSDNVRARPTSYNM